MSWYDKFKTGTKDHLVKGKGSKNYASSFWYDAYDYDYDVFDTYGGWGDYTPKQIESYKKTNNLYKLSSVRRAIANFVQIVTNK